MRRAPSTHLRLPEGIRYDCVKCGRACTDFWEVPVDRESEERLSRFDLKTHQQRVREGPPFIDSTFEKGGRSLNLANNACTFLCKDRTCALHSALGPRNKPQTCIDFPYRYVDTPGGTFVGVSFACTAVRANSGRLLTERSGELGENYAEAIHVKKAGHPRLTGRVEIEYAAYEELERALEEILALSRVPLALRLLSQAVLLDLAAKTFEAARIPGAEPPGVPQAERAAAHEAPDLMLARAIADRFRADRWGKLLVLAQKQRPSPMVHRAFIGLVTTFRQALWRDATRPRALLHIARHYILHAARASRIHLLPLERSFTYADFRTRQCEVEPGGPAEALLTRYFRHVLFRKDLLLAENVRAGHRFLLMHFALYRWYLVGLMAERAESTPSGATVEEALLNVEKYYVLHSTYVKFLERQPMLGTLIDAAIHTPRFAASMVHLPV